MVNLGGQHAEFLPTLVRPNDPDVPWAQQVKSFEKAVANLQSWFEDPLFVDDRGLSKGFRILGGTHGKHGLVHRPSFPYQEPICEAIQQHLLVLRADPTRTGGPTIPDMQPILIERHFPQDDVDRRDGWNHRMYRARRATRAPR